MINIRRANRGDLIKIIEIEQACFPMQEAASSNTLTSRFNTFDENFLVAIDEEKVIGFINGCTYHQADLPDILYEDTQLHDANSEYMMVFGLDVAPAHRKQGVARKLLEAYILLSKERNKKGIVLTCKDHLKSFYQGVGFIDEGSADSKHGGALWNKMVLYL